MNRHKAGLHKEVARIFDGVWIPQTDNVQQSFGTSSPEATVHIHPKPIAVEKRPKEAKAIKPAKDSIGGTWSFFSPKSRRERKRLSSISKNLLINLPS